MTSSVITFGRINRGILHTESFFRDPDRVHAVCILPVGPDISMEGYEPLSTDGVGTGGVYEKETMYTHVGDTLWWLFKKAPVEAELAAYEESTKIDRKERTFSVNVRVTYYSKP